MKFAVFSPYDGLLGYILAESDREASKAAYEKFPEYISLIVKAA